MVICREVLSWHIAGRTSQNTGIHREKSIPSRRLEDLSDMLKIRRRKIDPGKEAEVLREQVSKVVEGKGQLGRSG